MKVSECASAQGEPPLFPPAGGTLTLASAAIAPSAACCPDSLNRCSSSIPTSGQRITEMSPLITEQHSSSPDKTVLLIGITPSLKVEGEPLTCDGASRYRRESFFAYIDENKQPTIELPLRLVAGRLTGPTSDVTLACLSVYLLYAVRSTRCPMLGPSRILDEESGSLPSLMFANT
ncbi:hypothetical protein B0T25DRAFT_46418 [Lasiosphaeria hispida]|uniref:Uncharacterized protein n=1 Tax=Lasiosphaeria hispida TaxID=260671 RepID=A0AAJ0HVW7_9PEZI|nr:hypothetical protein B0T25DRAFT_46418 [Lasiosphaeria hispida]